MMNSVIARRHAAILLVAAMPTFVFVSVEPALANPSVYRSDPFQSGSEENKIDYYYYAYTKRWNLGGNDATDCANGASDSLPAGRYRSQIVRFSSSTSDAGESNVVAVRFGLYIDQENNLNRIADITTESTDPNSSRKDSFAASDKPPIFVLSSAEGDKKFSREFSEIVTQLIGDSGNQKKEVDPVQLMKVLCGIGKNAPSARNVKFTRINDMLVNHEIFTQYFARIVAFYDPRNLLDPTLANPTQIIYNVENYEGFVLAGFIGSKISTYHRDLYFAFRTDLKRAAITTNSSASASTTPAPVVVPAQETTQPLNLQSPLPTPLPQQTILPPAPSKESWLTTLGRFMTFVATVLGALLGLLLCGWLIRDYFRTKSQLTKKLAGIEDDVLNSRKNRSADLQQRLDEMQIRMESVCAEQLQQNSLVKSIEVRVENVETRLTTIEYQSQELDDQPWKEDIKRLEAIISQKENDISIAFKKSSNERARKDIRIARTTGRPPSEATEFPTRTEAGGVGKHTGVTAMEAGEPNLAANPPPDIFDEFERITGVAVDRVRFIEETKESRSVAELVRWLVQRYLPERREPAFYEEVRAWFKNVTDGQADLIVPAVNAVYQKELHDIGGYGDPRYGSLDQIVGLVRPGLRFNGRLLLKPRVIIPS